MGAGRGGAERDGAGRSTSTTLALGSYGERNRREQGRRSLTQARASVRESVWGEGERDVNLFLRRERDFWPLRLSSSHVMNPLGSPRAPSCFSLSLFLLIFAFCFLFSLFDISFLHYLCLFLCSLRLCFLASLLFFSSPFLFFSSFFALSLPSYNLLVLVPSLSAPSSAKRIREIKERTNERTNEKYRAHPRPYLNTERSGRSFPSAAHALLCFAIQTI